MISFPQLTLLHLSLIDEIGAVTISHIISRKSPSVRWQDLYALSVHELQVACSLTLPVARRVVNGLADGKLLEQELALISQHNVSWCTIFDDAYPAILKEIYAPPAVLYYQGSVAALNKPVLAMVGSRALNNYGVQVIKRLVPDVVTACWGTVSGGALGADSCVHQETLRSGGTTVAVLGSGLLKPYPVSNKRLFDDIVTNGGALVSPFPLNMQALPGNFPARNRIIAGMAQGCIIVQAAEKSGALITAQYALEGGRNVFAVPGHITDPLSAGCHMLLRQGAIVVHSSADVLSEYGNDLVVSAAAQREDHNKKKPSALGGDNNVLTAADIGDGSTNRAVELGTEAETVASAVDDALITLCRTPRSIDELLVATQEDYVRLIQKLSALQLSGLVSQNFMGMWEATGA